MFDPDLLEDVPSLSANPAADETRRNLYVLGLPHDFTLGHQLNVSWAVVQRSSGFLDGADRTLDAFSDASNSVKKPQQPPRVNGQLGVTTSSLLDPPHPPLSSNPRLPDGEIKLASSSFLENMGTTFASTLLVSNLCPWLFQTYIDIHALFAPYGQVKRITIIPPLQPVDPGARPSHAALVQYDDLQSALSALYQVNSRPFGTRIARASLFRDAIERVMQLQTPTPPKPTPKLSTTGVSLAQKQRRTIEASQINESGPSHATTRVNVH
ncbi:16842_t:CDS:2 [Acaulospora colombiana]|uniref:16842_t:CDS:1 n=1 Tax=Acaulospora colombiana TaxID=27376 RepID=A0ACA9M2Q4_9GLOM|nr:16842_t:CDS:2 [Acaulospora colombiana]